MARFQSFGAQHLLTVVGLAMAIFAMCWAGRRLHGTPNATRYERTIAWLVAGLWIAYQVHDRIAFGFDPRYSLPLQFCDLVALVAALAFARPRRSLHALAYFWGLALSTQAVLTPDLVGGPTTLAFWAFWAYHMFVVGAGVYVVAVRGFRPTWSDFATAAGLGVLYAAVVLGIDAAFGLNYGYLGRGTPSQPTLIDLLGPWPLRALLMTLLVVTAMLLLWLPWAISTRGRRSGSLG
jgi:hypothetical integral membrane protein (TIGR02206 family)